MIGPAFTAWWVAQALMQPAAYTVDRYTIDSGGGATAQGKYTVTGTLGQPDADPLQPATAGKYSLTGGFWFLVDDARTGGVFRDGFE